MGAVKNALSDWFSPDVAEESPLPFQAPTVAMRC
jgi:hypothetical protein